MKKDKLSVMPGSNDTPITKSKIQKDTKLTKNEYKSYVIQRANGLVVDKEIGEIEYVLFFKPNEYVSLCNLKEDASLTKEKFTNEMESIKDLQYFTFKVAVKNFNQEILKYKLSSEAEYEQRVNYFAFEMQHDLKLIEGGDTLPCVLFHFERNYGIAPNASFVLGFEKNKHEDLLFNKTFLYDDKIFGTGKVYITINKESIAEIPGLNFN